MTGFAAGMMLLLLVAADDGRLNLSVSGKRGGPVPEFRPDLDSRIQELVPDEEEGS